MSLEGRLLAVLDRHTAIPVPAVRGLVDEHDALPTPFVLLEAMPGRATSRTELGSLAVDRHRRIARETGRDVAELHALEAVDSYGFLRPAGPDLHGGRPTGDLDTIAVADPIDAWRARLRDSAEGTLDRLGTTRFADGAPGDEPGSRVKRRGE